MVSFGKSFGHKKKCPKPVQNYSKLSNCPTLLSESRNIDLPGLNKALQASSKSKQIENSKLFLRYA
jgi:hypothetical protein